MKSCTTREASSILPVNMSSKAAAWQIILQPKIHASLSSLLGIWQPPATCQELYGKEPDTSTCSLRLPAIAKAKVTCKCEHASMWFMSRCLGLKSCLDFACGLLVGRKPILMAKISSSSEGWKERCAACHAASNSGVDSGSSANAARSSLISSQKRMPCVAEIFLMNRYEQINI